MSRNVRYNMKLSNLYLNRVLVGSTQTPLWIENFNHIILLTDEVPYTKSAFNELNMRIINTFASLRLAVTELI